MKRNIFTAFLILLMSAVLVPNSKAQSKYVRTFDQFPLAYGGAHVEPLDDGGLMIVAQATANGSMLTDGLALIRYDACDKEVWSKMIWYGKASLSVQDIAVTGENELLITGYYSEEGFYDGFLIKLDLNGEVLFSNTYHINENEYPYSVGQLKDGRYFIYGNWNVVGSENDNFVLTFDQGGNLLSSTAYFNIPIWGRTIPTSDGGILARAGRVVYKIAADGSLQWGRELDGAGYYESKPAEVADGYVYARYNTSGNPSIPAYLFKLGFDGELLWVSDGFKAATVRELIALDNDELLVPAHTYVDSLGTSALIYHHFDVSGKLKDQYLQLPATAAGAGQVYSVVSGMGGSVYMAANSDNKLHLSKFTQSAGQLQGCEWVAVSAPMSSPSLNLSERTVTPHSLAVTQKPLALNSTDLDASFTEHCYREEALTVSLGPDTTVCFGSTLQIGSDREYPYYEWSTGATERYIEVNKAGTYILKTGNGCETVSDTMTVSLSPLPDTMYTVSPRTTTPLEAVHFSGTTREGYEISWNYGEGISSEPSFDHTFRNNGIFPVAYSFIDPYGCFYSDTIDVTVSYRSIWIPNSFTPNGDGLNDIFRPEGFGIEHYEMVIFNRWGERLFTGQNQGWDGRFNGNVLKVDGYVYEIKFTDHLGEEVFRRGVFTLIR